MEIRPFAEADWPLVWPIVRDVVRAADTFVYDPAMSEAEARAIWILPPPGRTVVAAEGTRILGTAKMGRNKEGPGSHVATASFMVATEARGRGVATALCRHALGWAKERGFAGMQFNSVAESNRTAIELYQRLGFPSSARSPAPSPTRRRGASRCTSCIAIFDEALVRCPPSTVMVANTRSPLPSSPGEKRSDETR